MNLWFKQSALTIEDKHIYKLSQTQ